MMYEEYLKKKRYDTRRKNRRKEVQSCKRVVS